MLYKKPDADVRLKTEAILSGLFVLVVAGVLTVSLKAQFTIGYGLAAIAFGAGIYHLIWSVGRIQGAVSGIAKEKLAPIPEYVNRDLFDDLPVPMVDATPEGVILRANVAAIALIGQGEMAGKNLCDIVEGMGRSLVDRLADTMKGFGLGRPEMARCYRGGQEVFLQVSMARMRRRGKTSILAIISDATELKTLEAQFVQSQKMQAVGQLAGGIAHDFNNILTGITGHADLLLLRRSVTDPDYGDLMQIKQNANRAAALIGQLLAFSRKQTLQPKSLKLNDTLSELSHLLNRLLGEKVALHTEHGVDLKSVRVDERQFEQVIVNLVVNARDAMPKGGTVVIRTRNEVLKKELCRDRATVHPGEYVIIEVRDTGGGIPDDIRPKIFEPFFTTKKVGEGTGLGLATVYGIVKQTGGFIFVDSDAGGGTVFSIYLPVNEEPDTVEEPPKKAPPTDLTGRGRILLVEDEMPVRAFAARALSLRGYTVTCQIILTQRWFLFRVMPRMRSRTAKLKFRTRHFWQNRFHWWS